MSTLKNKVSIQVPGQQPDFVQAEDPDFLQFLKAYYEFLESAELKLKDLGSKADREVFNKLFGKTSNPMQTIIGGMSKLSLITRRNLFYKDLITKNDEVVAAWRAAPDKTTVAQPMFARSEAEAIQFWGSPRGKTFRRVDVVAPAKTLDVGTGKKIATQGPQSGG